MRSLIGLLVFGALIGSASWSQATVLLPLNTDPGTWNLALWNQSGSHNGSSSGGEIQLSDDGACLIAYAQGREETLDPNSGPLMPVPATSEQRLSRVVRFTTANFLEFDYKNQYSYGFGSCSVTVKNLATASESSYPLESLGSGADFKHFSVLIPAADYYEIAFVASAFSPGPGTMVTSELHIANVVPEPSSMLLLAMGATCCAVYTAIRRRR